MAIPLPSFRITNFRAFEELEIPRLAPVTLVVGRNNTGKTTLLEAAWVYGNGGALGILRRILDARDDATTGSAVDDGFLEPESRFLTNLSCGLNRELPDATHHSFGWADNLEHTLHLWVLNRWTESSQRLQETFLQGLGSDRLVDKARLFRAYGNVGPDAGTVDGRRAVTLHGSGAAVSIGAVTEFPCRLIQSQGLDSGSLAALWDELVLSGREDQAVQALRLLDADVEKVSFVGGRNMNSPRIPMVRLRGISKPLPLKSMGDGMNRVLGLAAVSASTADGLALIDEFENGLHYTVQPAVWRFLLETARSLNVQVLATTHSWDCVTAFAEAAREDPGQAALVRLERRGGATLAKVVDLETLDVMAREGIEVR